MDNKFFDFEKAKVQTITLEQLSRTHKENDVYNNPLKGIYHFELLNRVIAMCEEQHFNVEVYDLFAAQNKDRNQPGVVLLPQVEQQFGDKAVEAHILRRVFANIRISDFDDANNTTNLAIAFHQKGIQAGFGNMVKSAITNACSTQATTFRLMPKKAQDEVIRLAFKIFLMLSNHGLLMHDILLCMTENVSNV